MSRLSRRQTIAAVLGIPAAFATLIGGEIAWAATRDYVMAPEFEIDHVVDRDGGIVAAGGPEEEGLVRMAVLGDSTVDGNGAQKPADTLPVLVAQRVASALGHDVHVTGFGVSGARVSDVLAGQVELLRDDHWDVVLVMIGGNDTTHLTLPGTFERTLREVVAGVALAAPDAKIVLGGIPRFVGVDALLPPLRQLTDQYGTVLARRQVKVTSSTAATFVDIAREASPRFAGVDDAMSRDSFHPSAVGYAFWADSIAPVVVDVVS